jgi:heterodisulfide reductase subunit C
MYATEKVLSENILRISGVNTRKCMKCGKCSATCPAFNEMDIHPHQFVSMVERKDINALLKSKSIWTCLSCFCKIIHYCGKFHTFCSRNPFNSCSVFFNSQVV